MTKFNFSIGMSASSLSLVALIIIAELSSTFKDILKNVFTHHWVGKAVIIILVFLVFGFLFKDRKNSDDKPSWYIALLSLAVILLFFTMEYFR